MLSMLNIRVIIILLGAVLLSASSVSAEILRERNVYGNRSEYKVPYRSDEYIEPSYKNFEFILWRYGGYDLEEEDHILRFIALNDCKLFKRYMNYDLEWTRIKKRYKEFLHKNHEMFPGKVRVRVPIGLKRFDEEKSIFMLSDDTKFDGIRILPVKRFDGDTRADCRLGTSFLESFKRYMLNDVIVSLKYPLTLTEIPVPRDEAKKYIEYVQRNNSYNQKVQGRIAYVFYDIDIFDYIRRTSNGGHLLYGEVVNVEIFANQDESFPLYNFDPKENIEGVVKRKSLIKGSDTGGAVEGEEQ